MQFQVTLSKYFEKKSKRLIKKLEEKIAERANDLESLLNTTVNHGTRYVEGQGISPYNDYRSARDNKQRILGSWRKYKNKRVGEGSIGYVFRSDAPHVKYLFGKADSTGARLRSSENRRYRSAKKHLPVYRKGQSVSYRANQLTHSKWERFKQYAKKALKEGVKQL